MEFKDRIRNLRTEKELSPSQLGAAMDKSEGAVRSWETGKAKPDADTLIKLARYFDCTIDYLLGNTNFKNVEERRATISTDAKLNENLSKLNEDNRKYLIHALNAALDYMIGSVFYEEGKRNLWIDNIADHIFKYYQMFLTAESLYSKVSLGGGVSFTETMDLLRDRANLISPIEKTFSYLLHFANLGIKDDEIKEITEFIISSMEKTNGMEDGYNERFHNEDSQ